MQAAADLIERSGSRSFSVHSLAEHLGVKPASLYNHMDSMDSLLLDICALYLREQDRSDAERAEGSLTDARAHFLQCASIREGIVNESRVPVCVNALSSCYERLKQVAGLLFSAAYVNATILSRCERALNDADI